MPFYYSSISSWAYCSNPNAVGQVLYQLTPRNPGISTRPSPRGPPLALNPCSGNANGRTTSWYKNTKFELSPFPSSLDHSNSLATSDKNRSNIHIYHTCNEDRRISISRDLTTLKRPTRFVYTWQRGYGPYSYQHLSISSRVRPPTTLTPTQKEKHC